MIRLREASIAVPLPAIIDWPVGDDVKMGVAIKMLEISFSNGSNGRNYIQVNTVRKNRLEELDI